MQKQTCFNKKKIQPTSNEKKNIIITKLLYNIKSYINLFSLYSMKKKSIKEKKRKVKREKNKIGNILKGKKLKGKKLVVGVLDVALL